MAARSARSSSATAQIVHLDKQCAPAYRTHVITNLLDLHRRAVDTSIDVVARSGPSDLDRPTPCAAWNLGQLLAHMTVQHHGFAAAAAGQVTDVEAWRPRPLAA